MQFQIDSNFAVQNARRVIDSCQFTDKNGDIVHVRENTLKQMEMLYIVLWRAAQGKDTQWQHRCSDGKLRTATGRTYECRKAWQFLSASIEQVFGVVLDKRQLEYASGFLERAGLIERWKDYKPGQGTQIPGWRRFFNTGRNFDRFNNYWKVIRVIPLRSIKALRKLFTTTYFTSLRTISVRTFGEIREVPTRIAYWIDFHEIFQRQKHAYCQ